MAFGKVTDDPYSLRDPYEEALRPNALGAQGDGYGSGFGDGFLGSASDADPGGKPAGGSAAAPPRAFGNRQLAVSLLVALALVICAFGYAWSVLRAPSIGAYADAEIEITGLSDEPFSVTPAQLAELKCSSLTVDGSGKGQGQDGQSKAGIVEAYGPTLARFLAAYGYEVSDLSRVVVTCSDGYKVTIHGDMLEGVILLSVAQGKAALDDYHQPLRLVMPAEESGKWCYGICRIDFTLADADAADDEDAEVGSAGDGDAASEGAATADASASAETSSGDSAAGTTSGGSAAGSSDATSGESFGSKYASA